METVHSQPFKKRCDNPPICKFVFCFGERPRRAFVANFSFQRMKYFSSNMFTSSLKENYHYSWSLLLQMLHKRMFPHENETHTLRQIVRSTAIFVLYTMPPSRSLSQRDRDSFDKVSRFRCSSLVHKVACTRVHCDLVHQVYPIGDVSRLYRLHFRGEKGPNDRQDPIHFRYTDSKPGRKEWKRAKMSPSRGRGKLADVYRQGGVEKSRTTGYTSVNSWPAQRRNKYCIRYAKKSGIKMDHDDRASPIYRPDKFAIDLPHSRRNGISRCKRTPIKIEKVGKALALHRC